MSEPWVKCTDPAGAPRKEGRKARQGSDLFLHRGGFVCGGKSGFTGGRHTSHDPLPALLSSDRRIGPHGRRCGICRTFIRLHAVGPGDPASDTVVARGEPDQSGELSRALKGAVKRRTIEQDLLRK